MGSYLWQVIFKPNITQKPSTLFPYSIIFQIYANRLTSVVFAVSLHFHDD